MDPTSLLILSRALERLLIVAFSGASLWMGWQLFLRLATNPDQQAEFSYREILVRLQRVGPGVFFAMFGAVVLAISLLNPLVVSDHPGNQEQDGIGNNQDENQNDGGRNILYYYLNSISDQELDRWITALNTNLIIAGIPPGEPIPEPDRELLARATYPLYELRNVLLARTMGEQAVAVWLRWRDAFRINPAHVPEEARELVESVEARASETYFEGEAQ